MLNVIVHAKFHVDRLRGFWAAGPQTVPFPILIGTTLTTVLHYRADCDTCTKFGVDSSSRFPFRVRTNKQTDRQQRDSRQADATERYTHAGGYTAGVGKYSRSENNLDRRPKEDTSYSTYRVSRPQWGCTEDIQFDPMHTFDVINITKNLTRLLQTAVALTVIPLPAP